MSDIKNNNNTWDTYVFYPSPISWVDNLPHLHQDNIPSLYLSSMTTKYTIIINHG